MKTKLNLFFGLLFLSTVFLSIARANTNAEGETIPDGETVANERTLKMVEKVVLAQSQSGAKPAHRDAHAKHHGCVKAQFKILDGLAPELRQGLFKEPKSYPAWIRYSNGSGKFQDDSEGDGRGMAVKVMNVDGEKLLDNSRTQDFLMINHPTFFVKDAIEYVDFQTVLLETGAPTKFFFPSLNPLNWRLKEANIAREIIGKKVSNMLYTQYFSMVPYKYGPSQIKYSAKPCKDTVQKFKETKSKSFLRENLEKHLAQGGACFDFLVQLRTKPDSMPIEDPTVEWEEKHSPFRPVARIEIAQQTFTSAEQMNLCENLSLNPWHALKEHRPLGGIGRTRKVVYDGVSRLRHQLNKTLEKEPDGF